MNKEARGEQTSEIIIYFRSSDKSNEKCQVTQLLLVVWWSSRRRRRKRIKNPARIIRPGMTDFCVELSLNWSVINTCKENVKINEAEWELNAKEKKMCRSKLLLAKWLSGCCWSFINFSLDAKLKDKNKKIFLAMERKIVSNIYSHHFKWLLF